MNQQKNKAEETKKRTSLQKDTLQKSIEDLDEIVNKFLSMEEITKTMLVQLIDKITISEEKEIKIYYKFNILNNINELTKLKVC